jgi:small GTP-binding protein
MYKASRSLHKSINHTNQKKCQWDTGGQERFKSLTQSYYRNVHGYILVYDVTNRESFENMQKWMSDIKINGCDAKPKILVANKCDLEEERVVQTQEGCQLAKKSLEGHICDTCCNKNPNGTFITAMTKLEIYNSIIVSKTRTYANFFEVSAKTSANVSNILNQLLPAIYDNILAEEEKNVWQASNRVRDFVSSRT